MAAEIGFLPPAMTSPFYAACIEGATPVAEAFGYDLLVMAPPSEDDYATQMSMMEDMITRGVSGIAVCGINLDALIPGIKKAQAQMAAGGADDKMLVHFDAIMGSMTPKERAKPEILTAKRKIRIANGSGTTVQQVNKVLKMHQEMSSAMKKIRKMGGLKGLGALFGKGGGIPGMGGGGGLPGGGAIPPELANLMNKKK